MNETLLEVKNLTKHFYGQKNPAIDSLSFTVKKSEFIVISGANGSGKSVLMHLIADLEDSTSGEITRFCNQIGLVFQNPDAQILGDTVIDDVMFGPINLGLSKKEALKTSLEALKTVNLQDKKNFPSRSLSGGEKRKLAVAGILAMDSDLLIFDEPYANLDWTGVLQVNKILKKLKSQNKTIIVLTHELEKVLAMSSRLIVLFNGKLVWDSTPKKALSKAPLETWGIRNPFCKYTKLEDLEWK